MSLDRVPAGNDVPHFEHYKDLEPGKWVRVGSWVGVDEAKHEILESIERYAMSKPKPGA